jgi:MFS family permease
MALSQAVLLRINPPDRHGRAMPIWGTGAMIGPIAGPPLGGWLADNYDWRWVFYINLPIGIIAFLDSGRLIWSSIGSFVCCQCGPARSSHEFLRWG